MRYLLVCCLSCLLLIPVDGLATGSDEELYKKLDQATDLIKNDQLEKGIELYNEVLMVEPDNLEALFFGGLSYLYIKDYAKAVAYLEEVEKLKPDFKNVYKYQAMSYMGLKEFSKAVEAYSKAIILSPEDENLYEQRGIIYLMLGQRENAKKDMAKVLQLNPHNPAALEVQKHKL